jgi:hypothetical protein
MYSLPPDDVLRMEQLIPNILDFFQIVFTHGAAPDAVSLTSA